VKKSELDFEGSMLKAGVGNNQAEKKKYTIKQSMDKMKRKK
jgi:hypothetical protein